ncbi:MAG: MarR family transcriptional regulator [Erysipelothrix sp.]|nr:MarR family transcriptional regulator [Erysipelothrix sp.]
MEKILNKQVRILMRKHQNIVQNYLSKLGLYMGQPRLLFYLEEAPGISQRELSEMLDITKEATSVSIRRLEKSGFIERKACTKDRRMNLLNLTSQGYDVVKNLRLNFDEINSLMFVDLNDNDKKELQRIISIMNESLEKRLRDEEAI